MLPLKWRFLLRRPTYISEKLTFIFHSSNLQCFFGSLFKSEFRIIIGDAFGSLILLQHSCSALLFIHHKLSFLLRYSGVAYKR